MSDHEEQENQEIEHIEYPTPMTSMLASKTGQLDDVLMEKLEQAFHKDTSYFLVHDIAKIASEHDPIDLAYAVTKLPKSARLVVYDNLPDINAKIIFMIHTGSNTRSLIFRQIDESEIKALLEMMPPDEAVAVLDDLSDRKLRKVLDRISPKKAYRIKELLKHDRNSAGRLMTNEFFAFDMNTKIKDVSSVIRDNPGIDLTRSIFVLSPTGELAGYVPVRNLIVNKPDLPLRQVMRPILHTVTPETLRDEVIDIVERYGVPTLPVIDESGHLVGVIAYEDIVEAMEDIADETIASIAGTGERVSEHESIGKRFMWRAPWLIVTLCAGIVTSTAMAHFIGLSWFSFVPVFVPLIAGMSGNVGLQCSTILVRGLATGELTPGSRRNAMVREITIGCLIGVAFGLFCGIVIFILNNLGIHRGGTDPLIIGTTVSAGLFGACMTATVLGTFSPFFFARIGVDPAVASGPIVTALNDVSSTLMFFLIARIVYVVFTVI